jgi:hypothetical protein
MTGLVSFQEHVPRIAGFVQEIDNEFFHRENPVSSGKTFLVMHMQ